MTDPDQTPNAPFAVTSSYSKVEQLARIRLIRSENVGPVTFHRLIERFGSATETVEALPRIAKRGGRNKPLKIQSISEAQDEIKAAEDIGAVILFHGDSDYPPLLAMASDSPPHLFVRGHGHLLKKRCIAMVGARNASLNGRRFAERLAIELGENGFCVVSGLARGIDAAAHIGALTSGTIAAVAGGADVVYPPENQHLQAEIAEQGAIVSEMPPGTRPQARHFPTRNRIIAAMARGVIVVEASPRSGSLITARMAGEYGRDVFAVPGAAGDPRARGTNQLIREGAILTESIDDILEAFSGLSNVSLDDVEASDFIHGSPVNTPDDMIDEARVWIETLIGPSPVTVDEIVRDGQFSPAAIAGALLELEIAGRLERHPGGKVSLIV